MGWQSLTRVSMLSLFANMLSCHEYCVPLRIRQGPLQVAWLHHCLCDELKCGQKPFAHASYPLKSYYFPRVQGADTTFVVVSRPNTTPN
ncbi:hypothetical protein B0I35DRAFT_429889 [Stachybotrys elegans]|uniref:Secreted protein n=1 Tax=Stachybotrys elegans TaxID=80388 RepID=A0A8K0WRQ9_9HYPO|nr:hypothetical protein B0I35DRAFT_429889 [Stachybotrys elegans]